MKPPTMILFTFIFFALNLLGMNNNNNNNNNNAITIDEISPECYICFEFYPMGLKLHCSHEICANCVHNWFQENTTCPVCRTEIAFPQDLIINYQKLIYDIPNNVSLEKIQNALPLILAFGNENQYRQWFKFDEIDVWKNGIFGYSPDAMIEINQDSRARSGFLYTRRTQQDFFKAMEEEPNFMRMSNYFSTFQNQNYININQRLTSGKTLLTCEKLYQTENGEQMIKLLVANGANIFKTDRSGNSPIQIACSFGTLDMVKCLREYGAKIETKELYEAMISGKEEFVKTFLKWNVDPAICVLSEVPVSLVEAIRKEVLELSYYCKTGDLESIIKLVSHGAKAYVKLNRNCFKFPLLFNAVRFGHQSIIQFLLNNGENINSKNEEGQTVLHISVENNNLEMVKFLTEKMSSLIWEKDMYGENVFHLCARNKYQSPEIVKYLLSHITGNLIFEIDVGHTPLCLAAKNQNILFINLFIQKQTKKVMKLRVFEFLSDEFPEVFDKIIEEENEFHEACKTGNLAIVEKFIKNDKRFVNQTFINISCLEDRNETNLYIASKYDQFDIVKCLVDNGATVNHSNHWGDTPLHACSMNTGVFQVKIIQYLIDHGADPNQTNDNAESCFSLNRINLHFAAMSCLFQSKALHFVSLFNFMNALKFPENHTYAEHCMVKELYFKYIDQISNIVQDTPLHNAVRKQNLNQVKEILTLTNDSTKSVYERNCLGETPVDICKTDPLFHLDHSIGWEILKLLEEYQASKKLMHEVCLTGSEEVVKIAITKHQANVNHINEFGETPLYCAIKHRYKSMAILLLMSGARATLNETKSKLNDQQLIYLDEILKEIVEICKKNAKDIHC